jgi:hypothetical protein
VPLTETLSGFFGDEYNRFMTGLDGLTLSDREREAKMTRRDRLNAAKPKLVEIPNWDDVIHLGPRLAVTKEQRDEYYQAARAGRTPALEAEVLQEIERRASRREAMARSAQPEFDRSWGSVLTAIDNVQDFLGAVSVLGRISLTIGAKVGLRAIPGLGTIVLAADVLSLALFIGQLAFPAWLALCAGPRAALRAGVGTLLTNQTFKRSTALAARGASRSLRWTGSPRFGAARISGAIGAALVIAQTTDQLFGIGISLGPIVGATMGAAYATEAKLRGEAVEVRRTPSVEHFYPRIQARLVDVPTSALYDRMTAAACWEQAALVLDIRSGATTSERQLTLASLIAAIGTLYRDWHHTNWQLDAPRLAAWHPTPPTHSVDVIGWQDFGDPSIAPAGPSWARDAGGPEYDIDQALQLQLPHVVAGIRQAIDAPRTDTERAFYGAVTNDATEALWLMLTDDPYSFRREFTPDWLATERMYAAGFIPHPGNDETRTQAFWDEALHRVENTRNAMQRLTDWTRLADEHQLDYIVAKPATFE